MRSWHTTTWNIPVLANGQISVLTFQTSLVQFTEGGGMEVRESFDRNKTTCINIWLLYQSPQA